MRVARRLLAAVLLAALAWPAVRPAAAADPQRYEVDLHSTGNGALNAVLRASSQLLSLRKSAPVGAFGLIDRAQQDIPRLKTALDSFGYYDARVEIRIAGHPLADPALAGLLMATPARRSVRVDVRIELGRLYHLRKVTIDGTVSPAARAAFRLKGGDPVVAAQILAARDRLLRAVEEQGHAYAMVSEPVLYPVAQQPLMDLSLSVDAGAVYHLGAISFEGLHGVSEAFVRQRLTIHGGDLYSPDAVERSRTTLLALGVFASVTVRQPPQGQVAGGRLPLTFVVVERKRHAVSLNAEYSSDLGVLGGIGWTDRNLFGEAEQLAVNATVFNLGGSASNAPGYDVSGTLTKPDFLLPDQSLQFSLIALRQNLVAYDQKSITGGVTVSRRLSTVWSVSAGATLQQEQINQNEMLDCDTVWTPSTANPAPPSPPPTCNYTLLGVPLSARYDSTDLANPLADPVHGMRASLSLTPTESLFHGRTTFLILQATASYYFDFAALGWGDPGRSVLALRAIAAQARGAGQFSLPPDQRFYAGGSATVRGYAFQSLGPSFPPPDQLGVYPKGGTGLFAGTIELRQRLWGHFGMAAFLDGGELTTGGSLLRRSCSHGYASAVNAVNCVYGLGIGAGPRYYTPIGPIRLDLAVPLNRRPNGDRFEAYIGIGQAF